MFHSTNPLKLPPKEGDSYPKTEEEILLEQDIEDKKVKSRRQELRLNYDEDSSDEDYDTLKKDTDVKVDDEDDDMFASDNDEKPETKKKDKKELEFMDVNSYFKNLQEEDEKDEELKDLGVIEDDSADNIEEEEEEIDDKNADYSYYNDPEAFDGSRPKPKVEPKMDAFNLNEETNEGKFDIDGNFIRNEDNSSDEEDKDAWYSGNSKKKEIEKTRKAKEERDKKLKQARKQESQKLTEQLLASMIQMLEPVETPMERLLSLNKARPKNKKQKLQLDPVKELERKKNIEEITSIANELISKGRSNIYDETREELMRLYREETGEDYVAVPRGVKRKLEDVKYEFMYVNDTEVHGEYTKEEMLDWKENYFDDNVLVRCAGDEEFVNIKNFSFN